MVKKVPPTINCQRWGASSNAYVLSTSNTNDPMNGAITLPGPDNIVMKTNSPDTVQLIIESGSTWPNDIAINAPAPPANIADIVYFRWIACATEKPRYSTLISLSLIGVVRRPTVVLR